MAHLANEKVIDMVMELVSDDHRAVDLELGLCRFCSARVESSDPRERHHVEQPPRRRILAHHFSEPEDGRPVRGNRDPERAGGEQRVHRDDRDEQAPRCTELGVTDCRTRS